MIFPTLLMVVPLVLLSALWLISWLFRHVFSFQTAVILVSLSLATFWSQVGLWIFLGSGFPTLANRLTAVVAFVEFILLIRILSNTIPDFRNAQEPPFNFEPWA